MADITDQHDQTSPTELDDHAGNGTPGDSSRGVKRARPSAGSDDDDDEKGGRERRKIEIKFIADKSRRHITFSKRKAGIMKKVWQSIAPDETTRKFQCDWKALQDNASVMARVLPCNKFAYANNEFSYRPTSYPS